MLSEVIVAERILHVIFMTGFRNKSFTQAWENEEETVGACRVFELGLKCWRHVWMLPSVGSKGQKFFEVMHAQFSRITIASGIKG